MKKVSEKVPMKEKLSWGLGGFSEQIAVNGLNGSLAGIEGDAFAA